MPCDFDMAFTDESANFGRGTEGDREIFEQYLAQEFQELGRSLAMSADSTGVKPAVALADPSLAALRLGLRDTLVRGWLSAAQGLPDDFAPATAEKHEAAYDLLTLAAIMSADVIA